jgi:protein ImuA
MASAARADLPSRADGPAALIGRLREKLRAVEASTGLAGEGAATVSFGIPPIDDALGGGLACGALHEIAAIRETEIAAATGFALALAARAVEPGSGECHQRVNARLPTRYARALIEEPRWPLASLASAARINRAVPAGVLWIAEELSLAENGAPYGPGLDEAGIAPERLITVVAARGRDLLWAMEEALRCRAIGVVIGEMRPHAIDQVATRRLALAAATGNTLGLLLRTAPDDAPSAAATRWIISTVPSVRAKEGERWGIGPPRLAARLVRNRRGHLGAWIVEWNNVEQRFELATHSEPVAGAPFDRPPRPAVA